jgi:hypothetical protein
MSHFPEPALREFMESLAASSLPPWRQSCLRLNGTASNFHGLAEILRALGGPAAQEANILSIPGQPRRRLHVPERNDVAEMIFMIRVRVNQQWSNHFQFRYHLDFLFLCGHQSLLSACIIQNSSFRESSAKYKSASGNRQTAKTAFFTGHAVKPRETGEIKGLLALCSAKWNYPAGHFE